MTYFQQSLPFIFPPASLCSIQITDSCTLITDLRYEIKKIPPNVLSLYQINNKHMDEITKIETVDQYDQLFGLETLHP